MENCKKVTIVIPNDTIDKLNIIRNKISANLNLSDVVSMSSTVTYALELMEWMIKKMDAGFTVEARKKYGDKLNVEKLPIKYRDHLDIEAEL